MELKNTTVFEKLCGFFIKEFESKKDVYKVMYFSPHVFYCPVINISVSIIYSSV